MTKPSLRNNVSIAVCDNNDTRVFLYGSNLEPEISKDDVEVEYKIGRTVVGNVDVKKAKVKNSVLILRMDKVAKKKSKVVGDDEITVTVTNPGSGEQSDPVDVGVVFEEGK